LPRSPEEIRQQIQSLVAEYHDAAFPKRAFEPGTSTVPVSGRVFDAEDMQSLIDAGLDFWLTTGRLRTSSSASSRAISVCAARAW
jgi:CDP-6-deoxy-D-xylo-4-hexulose-3-dehydrase